MNQTDPFAEPVLPPIADIPHRPVPTRPGRIHRNRHAKPGPIGNTVGVIVPKTRPALPGAPSNPPVVPETPAEQSWWQRWGSAVTHGVLDVVGLVPVFGEIADLANAGIYAAEGDYVNASLSLAAAVPFAGAAATATKVGMRATHAVSAARATSTGVEAAGKAGRQGMQAANKPVSNVPPKSTGSSAGGGARIDGHTKPSGKEPNGQSHPTCAGCG